MYVFSLVFFGFLKLEFMKTSLINFFEIETFKKELFFKLYVKLTSLSI